MKMLIDAYFKLLKVLIALFLAIMVVLVFGNVVLRYGFNSGITVSEEVSRWLFVWLTFLGAIIALREHGHLGVDMLVRRLPTVGKQRLPDHQPASHAVRHLAPSPRQLGADDDQLGRRRARLWIVDRAGSTASGSSSASRPASSCWPIFTASSPARSPTTNWSWSRSPRSRRNSRRSSTSWPSATAAKGGFARRCNPRGDPAMTIVIFVGSLLGAMAIGMPIAFALLLCGVALMVYLDIFDAQIVAQNVINGADSFPLMAVPFFMLAGEIMNTGGLSKRIVNVALALVGHVKGGLGYVAILAACILSALSGSAVADAAALSALLVPMMVKAGHDKARAGGLIAASGVIGPIIPPSIGFVVFGVVGGVSITKLFLAGIVPGHADRPRPGVRLVVGGAQGEHRQPRRKKSGREVGSALRRRLLGADAAVHHHLRPEVRRLHANRGGRGRRGLLAVRRAVRLPRAQGLGALTPSSSPQRRRRRSSCSWSPRRWSRPG